MHDDDDENNNICVNFFINTILRCVTRNRIGDGLLVLPSLHDWNLSRSGTVFFFCYISTINTLCYELVGKRKVNEMKFT